MMDWKDQTQQHIDNVQKLLAGFVEHVLLDCSPEDVHVTPTVGEAKSLPELVVLFCDLHDAAGYDGVSSQEGVDPQVREVLVNTCVDYEEAKGVTMRAWLLDDILARAPLHDASKLEEPEASVFAEYTAKLKDVEYGSPEYKGYLKEMAPALESHYGKNRHHPEHFPFGVNDMTLSDIVEMAIDFFAATLRMKGGGDFQRSVEINTERFKLTPATAQLLRGTEYFFEMMRSSLDVRMGD